jgi:hypothetical protein
MVPGQSGGQVRFLLKQMREGPRAQTHSGEMPCDTDILSQVTEGLRNMRPSCPATLALIATAWAFSVAAQSDDIQLTHPAIQYSRPSNDPVAGLLRRPEGVSRLTSEGPSGYLRSVLDALDVPVSSQIMVFSKGSVQSALIGANNPRALYFNDSVVVGWVRGGFVEIASQDPEQGTVFYRAHSGLLGGLSIERDNNCLSCHASYRTGGVPGMIEPMGQTRPLERRWGGWYVTGDLGTIQHFGNVDVEKLASGDAAPKTITLMSLENTFDTRGYLAPYSDPGALMVFEHQMQMINLLTRLGWETRVAAHEKRPARTSTTFRDRVVDVVDYMLFVDEAPIGSRIQSTSGFAASFSERGPRDSKGRSLRQLDLTTRLLRHPCSYMIYSAQFETLPGEAKAAIYERLWAILSGKDKDVR